MSAPPDSPLREGLAAALARPALLGWMVLAGLLQRLLLALALATVVRRLAGDLALQPVPGAEPEEMLTRTLRLAGEVLVAGLEDPGRLLAGLGLVGVVLLLGQAVATLALAAALAGVIGGVDGPDLPRAALVRGPRLFVLELLDGVLILAGVGLLAVAALLGGAVGMTLGRLSGALVFALLMGPGSALLFAGWLTLRAASLGLALGHPMSAALVEGAAFVRQHLGALLGLGAQLALRLFPLFLAVALLSQMLARSVGPLASLLVALTEAVAALWAYAALGSLGRALAEAPPPAPTRAPPAPMVSDDSSQTATATSER